MRLINQGRFSISVIWLLSILLGMQCNDSPLGSFWGQPLWVSSPRALAATLAAISKELFDRDC